MQYLLLIYGEEEAWGKWSQDEMEAVHKAHGEFRQESDPSGRQQSCDRHWRADPPALGGDIASGSDG